LTLVPLWAEAQQTGKEVDETCEDTAHGEFALLLGQQLVAAVLGCLAVSLPLS